MTKNERRRKEQRYLQRKEESLTQKGTDRAINIIQILPCYILARQGYGNIRLERFIRELWRLTDKIVKEPGILEKIADELEHDKGIRFDFANNCVDNLWRDEGDLRKVINKPRKVRI